MPDEQHEIDEAEKRCGKSLKDRIKCGAEPI
jgi:hypothetical protein